MTHTRQFRFVRTRYDDEVSRFHDYFIQCKFIPPDYRRICGDDWKLERNKKTKQDTKSQRLKMTNRKKSKRLTDDFFDSKYIESWNSAASSTCFKVSLFCFFLLSGVCLRCFCFVSPFAFALEKLLLFRFVEFKINNNRHWAPWKWQWIESTNNLLCVFFSSFGFGFRWPKRQNRLLSS